jgi:hypothetical protein
MSVKCVPYIQLQVRLSVFGNNRFKGGYLDVYRGSAYTNGWNIKMGDFD